MVDQRDTSQTTVPLPLEQAARMLSEWRITDNHVRQFYELMMAARNGDQP